MKLTKDEVMRIKAGEQEPFTLDDPKQISRARALCSYINTDYPEHPVLYYVRAKREKGLFLVIGEPREVKS